MGFNAFHLKAAMARVMSHVPFPQRTRRTWTGAEPTAGTCIWEPDLPGVPVNQQAPETRSLLSAVSRGISTGTLRTGLASASGSLSCWSSLTDGSSPAPRLAGEEFQPLTPYTSESNQRPKMEKGVETSSPLVLKVTSFYVLIFLNPLLKISFRKSI